MRTLTSVQFVALGSQDTVELPAEDAEGVVKVVFAVKVDIELGTTQHAQPAVRLVVALHHQWHDRLLQLERVLRLCKYRCAK